MSCQKCGWCCRHYECLMPSNKRVNEFMKARGFRLLQSSTVDGKALGLWLVDLKCPHLTETNECDIYETRPAVCRDYPGNIDYRYAKMSNQVALGECKGFRWTEDGYDDKDSG